MDSNALVYDYEVFLSFRGKDTRRGFTDVLYKYITWADIRVFRDDDELAVGDRIDSILEAIGSSKICIIIFSPNFAESKWCLREVTRMVELKKIIVPVFYDVSPDDVKLKENSVYVDDFKKLEQNQEDPVEIDNWKNALKKAASIKGRELGDKSYTQFCKELVNEVLSKLGPRKKLDIDHFVGDTNKATVIRLLNMGSSSQEVVYLGIHGMGGIGKTTITKLIYNEFLSSFEYCGFLSDVREFSATKGVDGLPTYLCDNLQPKFVTPFSQSEQIPNLFRNKKVLLILDDVDSDEQIKKIARQPSWFGSGSRIILTSRDKKVFKDFKWASKCEIQLLEMEELERGSSFELFSRCAFEKSSPPSSYQDLSERAVAYAGGLPLAITVVAKYLRNQKEAVWEDIIEKLKKTPPTEVRAKLLISYESLEEEQKKIFLDIACLFNQYSYSERSHTFYMWQACGLYPRWSIEVLESRSLIKVVEKNLSGQFYFQMHDQLRDLGRDIVIAKSGDNLMKQSRLWKSNEVQEVLKRKQKQENMIEGINLSEPKSFSRNMHDIMVFTDEEFVGFDNLRYLGLDNYKSKLIGDFSNLFPKLRWLQCGDTLEVRNLAPSNLVILNLSKSNVDEWWDGWSQILVSKHLKVLDLSWCGRLQRSPVFPKNMNLEILNLSGCGSLEYIDPSIGNLQHLHTLNLSGAWLNVNKLKNLPDSIGGLVKLERLNLNSSTFLVELPESFGNLHSLRELNLVQSGLRCLPSSIIRLEKLKKLDLSYSQLGSLPKLPSSLKVLRIGCRAINNPPDLSDLQDLTSLTLSGVKFNLFGSDRSSLSELQEDPNMGLLSLSKLLSLTLIDCVVITDITRVGEMQSLNSLTISGCPSLVSLVNLDKLKQLRKLWLASCPRLVGIPGVGKLRSLTELTVEKCGSLELIEDITGLEELKVLQLTGCPKLIKIPGLVNLKSLRFLTVRGCLSTEIVGAASTLEKLHGVVVKVIQDPRESVAQLGNMPEYAEGNTDNMSMKSNNELEDLTTIDLENLPGDNVEANSDYMQIHLGGLTTDQSELDDFPPRKPKRNWCCWKSTLQDTPT